MKLYPIYRYIDIKNNESWDAAEQGKLFWTVCFLYLCNGSEMDKLKSHLHTITGDVYHSSSYDVQSMKLIGEYLDRWERQRYINTIKNRTSEGEIVRYEVGLRAFHEIGYHNITKFVSKVVYKSKCDCRLKDLS